MISTIVLSFVTKIINLLLTYSEENRKITVNVQQSTTESKEVFSFSGI